MRIVLALVLCLGWASTVHAVTRYVDGNLSATCSGSSYSIANRNCSGSNGPGYKTIVEGMRALVASDQLYIRGGAYGGPGPSGNQIYGNAAADTYGCSPACPTSWATATRISNYPGETVTIAGGFNIDSAVLGSLPQYIWFQGDTRARFVFQNSSSQMFRVMGASHIRIQTLTVQNGTDIGIGGGGNCSTTFATDIQILDTLIQNNGDASGGSGANNEHGLYPGCSRSWLVDHNTFKRNFSFQIHFYASTPGYHMNATISNNTFEGRGAGSTSGGAILIAGGSGHRIFGNVVIGTGAGPQQLTACFDLYGSGGTMTGTEVTNNTCYGVFYGFQISSLNVSGTLARNNIFAAITSMFDPGYTQGSGTVMTNNLCPVGMTCGTASIVTNLPGFVAAGTDFHLAAGSVAIDKGLTLAYASPDIDGVVRPAGAYDLGAYERGGVAPPDPTAPVSPGLFLSWLKGMLTAEGVF